jgi:hypothetical protein
MSTQSVVSVRKGGEMALKFVVGCNGVEARKFADSLRGLGRVPDLSEALEMALHARLGCRDCLVLCTPNLTWMSDIDTVEDGGPLTDDTEKRYTATFNDPNWNPRWANGAAETVEVVDF